MIYVNELCKKKNNNIIIIDVTYEPGDAPNVNDRATRLSQGWHERLAASRGKEKVLVENVHLRVRVRVRSVGRGLTDRWKRARGHEGTRARGHEGTRGRARVVDGCSCWSRLCYSG